MHSRKQERTANSYGTHFKREANKVKLKRIFLVSYTENVSRYFGACSEDKINAIIPNSYGSPSNEAVACWKPTRKSSTSTHRGGKEMIKKINRTSKTTSIPEISNKSELLDKVFLPSQKKNNFDGKQQGRVAWETWMSGNWGNYYQAPASQGLARPRTSKENERTRNKSSFI